MTLNHDKKKLPLSRENCWRNVEKSKDFGRQSTVWFQSEIVYVQRKKGREGGRESREENKSEKRGGRKEEERRGKKSERRTFFAVKFSSMDEMNCTRDHKSGRKGKSKTKPLLAVKVYGVWTLQGRQREPVCVFVCVCGNGSETRLLRIAVERKLNVDFRREAVVRSVVEQCRSSAFVPILLWKNTERKKKES